jgi:hypothetical protein
LVRVLERDRDQQGRPVLSFVVDVSNPLEIQLVPIVRPTTGHVAPVLVNDLVAEGVLGPSQLPRERVRPLVRIGDRGRIAAGRARSPVFASQAVFRLDPPIIVFAIVMAMDPGKESFRARAVRRR